MLTFRTFCNLDWLWPVDTFDKSTLGMFVNLGASTSHLVSTENSIIWFKLISTLYIISLHILVYIVAQQQMTININLPGTYWQLTHKK